MLNNDPKSERCRVGSRVTIYQTRKSPFWYADYSFEGKQVRQSLKTTSKKQAITIARKLDAEIVLGKLSSGDTKAPIITSVVDKYLRQVRLKKRSEKTLDQYDRDLQHFVAYCRSRRIAKLRDVSVDLLEDYMELLESTGLKGLIEGAGRGRKVGPLAERTRNTKVKMVRQLIRFALKRGIIREDPAKAFEWPDKPRTEAFCWSKEQLALLRQHATEEYLPILDFLRLTDLRVNEFCWLMKQDVVWEPRPHLLIRRKVCPITGEAWNPKHKLERVVPLCSEAADLARKAIKIGDGPWLFVARYTRGTLRYTAQRVARAVERTRSAAGLSRGTPHTFRHVFGSFLASAGCSPYWLMKVMGHRDISTTLVYFHLRDGDLLAAIDRFDFGGMIGGVGPGDAAVNAVNGSDAPPPATGDAA